MWQALSTHWVSIPGPNYWSEEIQSSSGWEVYKMRRTCCLHWEGEQGVLTLGRQWVLLFGKVKEPQQEEPHLRKWVTGRGLEIPLCYHFRPTLSTLCFQDRRQCEVLGSYTSLHSGATGHTFPAVIGKLRLNPLRPKWTLPLLPVRYLVTAMRKRIVSLSELTTGLYMMQNEKIIDLFFEQRLHQKKEK